MSDIPPFDLPPLDLNPPDLSSLVPADFRNILLNRGPLLDLSHARTWAWVLGGGGAKGSFQVGALMYLAANYDRFAPRAICGTSVGAINAITAAEGRPDGFKKLLNGWLALASDKDMYLQAPWIGRIKRLDTFSGLEVEDFISSGSSGDIRLMTGAERLVMQIGTLIPGVGFLIAAGIDDIEDDLNHAATIIQGAKSLYVLNPIADRLHANIDIDAIAASNVELRLVSVALETGELCYVNQLGELTVVHDDGTTSPIELTEDRAQNVIDGALASAAIPGIFEPIIFQSPDGSFLTCVDGGARDILPMQTAMEIISGAIAQPTIIAISADTKGLNDPVAMHGHPAAPDFTNKNMFDFISRGVDILTEEIAQNDRQPLGGWHDGIDRIFITPWFNVHGTLEIDPGLISIALGYGYMTAFDTLERRWSPEDYEALFASTNEIAQERRFAWNLETRARAGVGPSPIWERDVLLAIRRHKVTIFESVKNRLDSYGRASLPPDFSSEGEEFPNIQHLEDWWTLWELHQPNQGPMVHGGVTNPFTRLGSPWEASIDTEGDPIPVGDPPVL